VAKTLAYQSLLRRTDTHRFDPSPAATRHIEHNKNAMCYRQRPEKNEGKECCSKRQNFIATNRFLCAITEIIHLENLWLIIRNKNDKSDISQIKKYYFSS